MYEELLLVGNPNVGKTSVFNRLTRSSEHVGNWHGVTVAEKSKIIQYDDKALKITDLPGLYSLSPYSPEEQISVDKILHDNSSLIIAVCEVVNLQRNLFFIAAAYGSGEKRYSCRQYGGRTAQKRSEYKLRSAVGSA